MAPHTHPQIGIIGAGHLGICVARILLAHGWPRHRWLISHRRGPASLSVLAAEGFLASAVTNQDAVDQADFVFLTVRPGDLESLRGLSIPPKAVLVSCLAGVSISAVEAALDHPAVRVLPSSPTSLEHGIGIAGVFPRQPEVEALVDGWGIEVKPLAQEEDFHAFCACLCLPAALLEWQQQGRDLPTDPLLGLHEELPGFPGLIGWARSVTPQDLSAQERQSYIARMATPGGVTEAMVRSLEAPGADFSTAFAAAIARSRELADQAAPSP